MRFQDRLKSERQKRGMSQQALANAIYVSRSAVAKWENGLGVPSKDSYRALLAFFEVSEEDFPLNEAEEGEIVCRNLKVRCVVYSVFAALVVLLTVGSFSLYHAIDNGFGFSADMAAGEYWRDERRIETDEYIFYYDVFTDPSGAELDVLSSFCVLKKEPLGYQRLNTEIYRQEVYSEERGYEGIVYSFPERDGYCHIFRSAMHFTEYGKPGTITVFDEIRIKEETFPVTAKAYFETPFALTEFWANDRCFTVQK